MLYIDFHIDTLMSLIHSKSIGKAENETLWQNEGHVDIKRLIEKNYSAQFFACFLYMANPPINKISYFDDALYAISYFKKEISNYSDSILLARNYKDYEKIKESKKISAFLTIEEGGIIDNKIDRLDILFEEGIRAITLTWNFENCIGYPNHEYTYKDKGLKPFGIEVVEKMDDLGIMVDVSHLSDQGFYDVCKYGKRPFIATHSNARHILGHNRNLTDDMIRKLADKGGIVGLNFAGIFLQQDGYSGINAMLEHLRHFIKVGGIEVIGLGSDFDGFDGEMEMKGVHDLHKLVEAMEKGGFSSNEIEKICYKNAEEFFKRYWN